MSTASIIVPAYNAADTLPKCLRALAPSIGTTTDLVVVDDGSTDASAAVAEALNVQVLRRPAPDGPAAARNHGVRHTTGEVLVFVDADVEVAPGAVARALETLAAAPELAGVFGSYDDRPSAPGLVSQFRNLLHHYVHQHGAAEAFTFWAGFGALRRDAFVAAGGFDERGAINAIEDVDLGYRLRASGFRLRLDRDMLCTHHKRWTLASMVRADVISRAVPWSRLVLRTGVAPPDLNLAGSQRWSVALAGVLVATLPLLAWPAARFVAAAAGLGVVALNGRFYGFLQRARGTAFAVACVPLHLLHFACGGFGFLWAWGESLLPRRTTRDAVA
ncbi:MAG TPA: glycosyltransferase family 2 protein [Candidatus Eisenbacteria bacterium]|nr:glycosyltransferase family 2 protein [Candidatus Eisenbacteria bacterium]